jgi:hypothetical protein
VSGRRRNLSILRPAPPVDLGSTERNVFSQSGEDGVIEAIFSVIEPTRHYSVEFGYGDGAYLSNTRNLLVNHGWSGLLIDGDHEKIEKAKRVYAGNQRGKVVEAAGSLRVGRDRRSWRLQPRAQGRKPRRVGRREVGRVRSTGEGGESRWREGALLDEANLARKERGLWQH